MDHLSAALFVGFKIVAFPNGKFTRRKCLYLFIYLALYIFYARAHDSIRFFNVKKTS